ncbi:MAG: PLD nuclease N-terminal domain-containing protein [Actinomycetota bacterium]|nr:PLD nuclease N-terminal domain-containing protein [Actinomycetota bacterium]
MSESEQRAARAATSRVDQDPAAGLLYPGRAGSATPGKGAAVMAGVVVELTGTAVVVVIAVCLVAGLVWFTALISVLTRNDDYELGSQLLWTLVILFAGPIGAVLYFVLTRESHLIAREPVPDRRRRAEAIAHPWSGSSTAR